MKRIRKFRYRTSYHRKMQVIMLALAALPVSIMGVLAYTTFTGAVQDKVNEANQQVLYQTMQRVEQLLRLADNSTMQLVSSEIIEHSLQNRYQFNNYSEYMDYSQIVGEMDRVQLDGIRGELTLYNTDYGWIIGRTGARFFPVDEDESALLKLAAESKRNSFWTMENGTLCLVKSIPINAEKPKGYLVARIALNSLKDYLGTSSQTSQLTILDEHRQIIISQNYAVAQSMLTDQTIVNRLSDRDTDSSYLTYKGPSGLLDLTFRKSSYNNWKYLSLTPVKELTRESAEIGRYTLYMVMGILVAAGILAIVSSRNMYSPISRLYRLALAQGVSTEKAGLDETTNLGLQDELQAIGERFRAALQNETKLSEELDRYLVQSQEYFTLRIFMGEVSPVEIDENIESFGINFTSNRLGVMMLQIDTWEGTPYEEKDRKLLTFAIHNIVQELMEGHSHLSAIMIGHTSIVLLMDTEADGALGDWKTILSEQAQHIQRMVKKFLRLKISIGISRQFSALTTAHLAYREANEALKYRMRFGEEAILFIEDVQPAHRVQLHYPKAAEMDLLDAIKLINREKVYELLEQMVDEILQKGANRHESQASLLRLLLEILRLVQENALQLPPEQFAATSWIEELLRKETPAEIKQWLRRSVVDVVMKLMQERMDSQQVSISSEIIRMVHQEFDTELTLEACAARLNYHSGYVGRVFRKEMGTSFSDYLSEYRLGIAKRWLEQTDMKISEISERLKYTSSANFIRYFRKGIGLTPGQYREMFQNKGK